MGFTASIRADVNAELAAASEAEAKGDPAAGFRYLERAHVLGQASTLHHVRVHVRMLLWGLRRRSLREVLGQLGRLVGAATKTIVWVPVGNTGGAGVSPFRAMPIPADLQRRIDAARRRQKRNGAP